MTPFCASPRELHDDELFRSLPVSFSIVRIYSRDHRHDAALNQALTAVPGDVADTLTNM